MATGGEEAVRFLTEYGLAPGPRHPLPRAIALLRQTAERGTWGTLEQRHDVALALAQVGEWHAIGLTLNGEPVPQIQEELAAAIRTGAISREAEEARTQFWFGMLLARSGLRPGVPAPFQGGSKDARRRPDFLGFADGEEVAFEVKRPESPRSAKRAIESGARQIRDFGNRLGFIAVDLSLVLDVEQYVTNLYASPALPDQLLSRAFVEATRHLDHRVRGYNAAGKFSRILGLLCYTRVYFWHHSEPDLPQGTILINTSLYEKTCGGIMYRTAKRIRDLLLSGLGAVSGTPTRRIA
jgi:hypothetical protein